MPSVYPAYFAFCSVLMVSLTTELVLFVASQTSGVNNQPVAFGDTGGVNDQPVAYSDTDSVNRIFVVF